MRRDGFSLNGSDTTNLSNDSPVRSFRHFDCAVSSTPRIDPKYVFGPHTVSDVKTDVVRRNKNFGVNPDFKVLRDYLCKVRSPNRQLFYIIKLYV